MWSSFGDTNGACFPPLQRKRLICCHGDGVWDLTMYPEVMLITSHQNHSNQACVCVLQVKA